GRSAKKGMIEKEPPSGTRDFYPAEMRARNWLFSHFREVARIFAFQVRLVRKILTAFNLTPQEYDAPVLEGEELYVRKAGEEITEQMYNFVDKDGYKVTLRPEMTPSLARM